MASKENTINNILVPLEQVRIIIKIEIFKATYDRRKLMNIIYISIVWDGFNFSNKNKYEKQVLCDDKIGIKWTLFSNITSNNQETQQYIIVYQTYKVSNY